MSKKRILHFVTPLKNVSPFDVNMAADAGFDIVVPYTDVDLKELPISRAFRSSRTRAPSTS